MPILADKIVTNPQGNAKKRLIAAGENAQHALLVNNRQEAARSQQLALLAKHLSLPKPPHRLECFDISHNMGEETIASRVVFCDGIAYRRGYRLYTIGQAARGDDYAAIREAVYRCYRRTVSNGDNLPDIIFVDGGVGQVNAAKQSLSAIFQDIPCPPLLGIAKGPQRKAGEEILISDSGEVLKLPETDGALHLIQALRDEAHRFALTGHRRRRDKKRSRFSVLEGISGIGPEKKRLLITTFGGLAGLRAAGKGDLTAVPGIGQHLAKRIYQELHR